MHHLLRFVRPLSMLVAAVMPALLSARVPAQSPPWDALSGGVADEVYALARYQGDLIVGGAFEFADGIPARGLARWDGCAWHEMGDTNAGTVRALLVHAGILYVSGAFINSAEETEIAVLAWDGEEWTVFDDGNVFTAIDDLLIYNEELVIAADRHEPGHPFNRDRIVMRWDGAEWQPLGDEFNSTVTALAVYNGELIVGGSFTRNHLYDINGIARWDGTTWQRLGNGLVASGIGEFSRDVHDLQVYEGKLFAAGSFSTAGGRMVRNIARWNGTEWRGIQGGANDTVTCLTVYQNDLIAGGFFSRVGGVNANRVARWDAQHGWRPVGKGFNSEVLALSPSSDGLVAGGRFWKSGARDVNFVALWPHE